MLRRTMKNTRVITALVIMGIIAYSGYYVATKPELTPTSNIVMRDISFFQTHTKKNVIFMLSWKKDLEAKSASDMKNYTVEQVEPDGSNWKAKEGGKKCTISFAQYVYSPWLDTEDKRKKAAPLKPDESARVTQLFVDIQPKEELNDYFRVTVRNVTAKSGENIESESTVIKINDFNKFIKM
jgi:hypothetical protein